MRACGEDEDGGSPNTWGNRHLGEDRPLALVPKTTHFPNTRGESAFGKSVRRGRSRPDREACVWGASGDTRVKWADPHVT